MAEEAGSWFGDWGWGSDTSTTNDPGYFDTTLDYDTTYGGDSGYTNDFYTPETGDGWTYDADTGYTIDNMTLPEYEFGEYGYNSGDDYGIGDSSTSSTTTGGKKEGSWYDSLISKDTLAATLGGAAKLAEMYGNKQTADAALKRAEEADKMKMLIELAKLKYGQKAGGGGGGGSGRSRYLDIINAMEMSKQGQADAFKTLMAGYNSAYGG